MKHSNTSGFTLIEFIIVIVLTGIIFGIITAALNQGLLAYIANKNLIEADWQARLALERISRDLRSIRSPTDITTASATQLSFTDIAGNATTYQFSGNMITLNSNILADGINSLSFSYFDEDGANTAILSAIRYITTDVTINLNNTNYVIETSTQLRDLS